MYIYYITTAPHSLPQPLWGSTTLPAPFILHPSPTPPTSLGGLPIWLIVDLWRRGCRRLRLLLQPLRSAHQLHGVGVERKPFDSRASVCRRSTEGAVGRTQDSTGSCFGKVMFTRVLYMHFVHSLYTLYTHIIYAAYIQISISIYLYEAYIFVFLWYECKGILHSLPYNQCISFYPRLPYSLITSMHSILLLSCELIILGVRWMLAT